MCPRPPDPPSRISPRLKGYDYTEEGAYFVTVCTAGRKDLLGEVVEGRMVLSPLGEIVKECWGQIPLHARGVRTYTFQVMPDHVHGIIEILPHRSHQPRRDVACNVPTGIAGDSNVPTGIAGDSNVPTGIVGAGGDGNVPPVAGRSRYSAISPRSSSLGAVVRSFKSAATKAARESGRHGSQPLWQQRYHDHIIRSPREQFFIERYIELNPLLWQINHAGPIARGPALAVLRRRLQSEFGLNEYEIEWVLRPPGLGAPDSDG